LAYIYPYTGLDASLIEPFYDAHALAFPLKNDSFLENVMHKGLRELMIMVSLMMLDLWIFMAIVISTSAISVLKYISIHRCPWDISTYGGTEPWIPLFGNLTEGAKPGQCFPGGHASGEFALITIFLGFRDTLSNLAKIGLILGLFLGFAMGWGK